MGYNSNGNKVTGIKRLALTILVSILVIAAHPAPVIPHRAITVQDTAKHIAVQPKKPAVKKAVPKKQTAPAPKAVITKPLVVVHPATNNCGQWRSLVSKYSWNVDVALSVINAESRCNPNAENATDGHGVCLGSRGLFQIGCDSTDNYASMFDPALNIAQAYALYSHRGWQPWGTCNRGIVSCY